MPPPFTEVPNLAHEIGDGQAARRCVLRTSPTVGQVAGPTAPSAIAHTRGPVRNDVGHWRGMIAREPVHHM